MELMNFKIEKMMKFKQFLGVFPLFAMALTLGACDNDEILNSESENGWVGERVPMSFTATADASQTRTVLANTVKVAWQKGDEISILPLNAEGESGGNDKFVTQDNSFTATFSGSTGEYATGYIALYPYQEGVTGRYNQNRNRPELSKLSLPSEQVAVAGTFNPAYNLSAAYAQQGGSALSFQNLCGLVKFRMAGPEVEKVAKVTLTTLGTKILAANPFTVGFSATSYLLIANAGAETSQSITLKAPEEGFKANADYYFVILVPGGADEQISLTFIDADGRELLKKTSAEAVPLKPNEIMNLGEFVVGTLPERILYTDFLRAASSACSLGLDTDLDENNTIPFSEEIWAKIKAVTELRMKGIVAYNYPIKDLSGIEYFTNLKSLEISDQEELETLDLSGSPQLESLTCQSNPNLKKVNFNGLYNLKEVNISSCNAMEELCIDGLVSLETLTLRYNESLNQLSFNNLPSLTELSCTVHKKLSSMEVSMLTSLTKLDCSSNNLSSLNVDNLTNLTELNCTSNSLSSLNVDNVINLTKLICTSNSLSSLNVDNLTNLTWLGCNKNNLKELSVVKNSKLTTLHCGEQKTGQNIKLTLTPDQKAVWDEKWGTYAVNANVDLYNPEGQPYN